MIVVPYTRDPTATESAILTAGFLPVGSYVGGSDRGYFDLLRLLWVGPFTVVEHDVIPDRAALVSFEDCPRDWCACPYPYLYGEPHAGLGCARFSGAIVDRHPDLMDVVAEMSDVKHPPMHWCRLDAWITNTLTARGETRCEDHPSVRHEMAQRGSSHGCYVIT